MPGQVVQPDRHTLLGQLLQRVVHLASSFRFICPT
jgi:hypothetical protein